MGAKREDKARGRRIAERRRAMRLSQAELANHCGVHVMSVSEWERGTARPERKLVELATALEVEPAWIYYGVETADIIALEAAVQKGLADPTRKGVEPTFAWQWLHAWFIQRDGQWIVRPDAGRRINAIFRRHKVVKTGKWVKV